MKFLADEGLDFPLVELLRRRGYEVIYAAEEMNGASDVVILERAVKENCICSLRIKILAK